MPVCKLLFFCIIIFPGVLLAQNYSGKWYGRAEAKASTTYNTYLCELIIVKKGSTISGELNYFFGRDEYHVKVKGVFHPATQTIELVPFNLITFFSKDKNGPDCIMDGSLTLYIDGKDSILYGQLNPLPKHKLGCPVMEINLQKEDLQEPDEEAPVEVIGYRVVQEIAQGEALPVVPLPVPIIKDSVEKNVISALSDRTFAQGPLITVSTDTIELHLYDNGKVDNDTVSVFFNRKPVALLKRLNTQPVVISLVLKPGENEIAMYADNLGEIAPNTALCIIYAGHDRYDINLTSNLLTNGTVRIKRKE